MQDDLALDFRLMAAHEGDFVLRGKSDIGKALKMHIEQPPGDEVLDEVRAAPRELPLVGDERGEHADREIRAHDGLGPQEHDQDVGQAVDGLVQRPEADVDVARADAGVQGRSDGIALQAFSGGLRPARLDGLHRAERFQETGRLLGLVHDEIPRDPAREFDHAEADRGIKHHRRDRDPT